jgi:DNA-binding NarL/FixJ family response regulator
LNTAPHISILVVDDHPLLREGVMAVVRSEPDMSVEWEAGDGEAAVAQYRTHSPDVVLMDLRMPVMDGTEAIRQIIGEFAEAKVLVLTTYKGDFEAFRAIRAGARGYLLKDAIRTELADAIRQVHAGKRRISPELGRELEHHAPADLLTARELAVLQCLAEGQSNRQMADVLLIAEVTIKVHLKSIFGKLHANDRTHAVLIAIRRGLIAIQ